MHFMIRFLLMGKGIRFYHVEGFLPRASAYHQLVF